jgi:hypothetical protein
MAINTDRIDNRVLALLKLGRLDGQLVCRSFDWAAMERLREKGLISNPRGAPNRRSDGRRTGQGGAAPSGLIRDASASKAAGDRA